MKNRIQEKGLFKDFTFQDVMTRLDDCIKTSEDENASTWKLCSMSKKNWIFCHGWGWKVNRIEKPLIK